MSETAKPPTTSSKKLLNSVLWFGVGFAAGLAPFLGKAKVPGFSALIEMYPLTMRDWLIPASGILMGILAAVIEYFSYEELSRNALRWLFIGSVALFSASFITLVMLYPFYVVRPEKTVGNAANEPEQISFAVVTGTPEVPRQAPGSACHCREGDPAGICVKDMSLDPANVPLCFGVARVAQATRALAALYFALTGSFVAAIGFLVLSRRR